MSEMSRLVLLLAVVAAATVTMTVLVRRAFDDSRRIRQGLKAVLGVVPHALVLAPSQGRGAGFDFGGNVLAVVWERGAWGYIYRLDELSGCELIVDGLVTGRTYRNEIRRAVDRLAGAERQVRLRFIFDDPHHPDFDLDLWTADSRDHSSFTDTLALEEANRWLARTEALLRRHTPRPRSVRATIAPGPATPETPSGPVGPGETHANELPL